MASYKYLNAGEPYQDQRGKETGGKKKDRRKPRYNDRGTRIRGNWCAKRNEKKNL